MYYTGLQMITNDKVNLQYFHIVFIYRWRKISRKYRDKLCKTAQADTTAVHVTSFKDNPFDKQGNRLFHSPNVLSIDTRVLE